MNNKSLNRYIIVSAIAGLLMLGQAWGAQKKGPVKVFILAGQSNMDGQAEARTIDFLGEDKDPARAALLKTFKPDGKTLVMRDDVWITSGGGFGLGEYEKFSVYGNLCPGHGGRASRKPDCYSRLGSKIGPEYAFGYYMGEALDQQILLIKYGPGGQSLGVNFRPPSAGIPVGAKLEDVGGQYRLLVGYVRDTLDNLKKHWPTYDEKAGYEIVGFVWFQGYNDKGNKEYAKELACLINDLRKEFKAPDMKAVIGVIGVNGVKNEIGTMKDLRDAQRSINTMPEFKGNAKAIESAPLLHPDIVAIKTAGWLNMDRDLKKNPITSEEDAMLKRATSNFGFHYFGEGRFFILLGKAFADTMLDLLGMETKVVVPRLNTFAPPIVQSNPGKPVEKK